MLTGYRFRYRVNLKYRTSSHTPVGDITMTMMVTHPRYLNDVRNAKKLLAGELIKALPKSSLCNGEIVFQPVFYLGFWR